MKTNRGNTVIQYRFSLVEILVAIAIIAILLGLSGAGYNAVQRKIARTRTEATLNKIRVGLESYKSKMGYYPQQPAIGPFQLDINDPADRLDGTKIAPQGYPNNNFNQFIEYGKISKEDAVMIKNTLTLTLPYTYLGSNDTIDIHGEHTAQIKIYRVIDGWKTEVINTNIAPTKFFPNTTVGEPYILYVCPGFINTSSYDLFSAGNDRKFIWREAQINNDVKEQVNTDNIWPQGLKTQ